MAISTDIRAQVHECLRLLAGICDGASSTDGKGFNKMDAYNGKRLAAQDELSPSDVLYGAKMLQKYHNQIVVPDLRAAKRYFAINGPRRGDDIIVAIEETDDEESMSVQMEEETYTEAEEVPAQPTTEITLSGEQQALFKVMESTKQHLFITGRAGTGKSVLLRHFRENTKKRIVVCAPTGIAALNVRGQTIHSLFHLAPSFQQKGSLAPDSKVCSILKRIDAIVIDEISMVRADLLDAIDARLREAHGNSLPFGGAQLIMFGDCYQLPPVVEDGLIPYFELNYNGYFFFHASAWEQTQFKIYELSQVFRQRDPVFKEVLNAVRDGSVVDEQIEQLNVRCGVPIPAEGTITLATTNNLVTTINQRRLDQLPGKAFEYRATITGQMKRGTFPTEEIIQLKVGAQVVLLQNDKDKRWVNGSVGTIAELKKDGITVKVDGINYGLEKATWEEIRYEYDPAAGKVKEEVTSSFTQYPVRLAWAMTIHKSQGQTYESVALDLTVATFAPGQLYVALSRATSLEGLYLKMPVLRKHIIVEPKVAEFMSRREDIATVKDIQPEEIRAEAVAIVEEALVVAESLGDCAESVSIIRQAQEEAELLLEHLEQPTVNPAPVIMPVEPSFSPRLADFFNQAIADAASRGFTVQAITTDAVVTMPTVSPENASTAAVEAPVTEQPVTVEKPAYPVIVSAGGKAKAVKKETVGVAYNFPPDVVEKLKLVTTLVEQKYGDRFDKSGYIAGVLVGLYPNLDTLIAQLQD